MHVILIRGKCNIQNACKPEKQIWRTLHSSKLLVYLQRLGGQNTTSSYSWKIDNLG